MTSRTRCPEATYPAMLAVAAGLSARFDWLSVWASATAGPPVNATKERSFPRSRAASPATTKQLLGSREYAAGSDYSAGLS